MKFCGTRAKWGFLGSVLVLGACSSTPPPAESPSADSAAASPPAARGTKGTFTSTWLAEVSIDEKFTALFESPEVGAAGERLWARLEADPELQRTGDAIITRLTQSPELARLSARLAEEHPDWGEAEFGAYFGSAVEDFAARPEYDQAFRRFAETPSAQAAMQEWAQSFTVGDELALALGQFLAEPDWQKIWQRRVGPTTDSAELVSRVDTYLVSDRGSEDATAIGDAVLSDPRLPGLLAELIDSPIVTRILVTHCRKLLKNPSFQRDASATLLSVFARDPWSVQTQKLEKLLLAAPIQKMLEGVLLDLAAQPELHQLVISRMSDILGDLEENETLRARLSTQKI